MSMGDDHRKYLSAIHEVMRQLNETRTIRDQAGAATDVLRLSQEPSLGIRRMVEDLNRNKSLIQAALGPLEEIRRMSGIESMAAESAPMQLMLEEYKKQFQLPQVSDAHRMLKEMETSGALATVKEYQSQADSIRRAMEAMRSPWLDMRHQTESIAGLVGIQSIGLSLESIPAFDDALTDSLRKVLGDWRRPVPWPESIFDDPLARSKFYAERGLDSRLTNFPSEAFDESLSIAGLDGHGPAIVEPYRGDDTLAGDEEVGFERTNAAHDHLLRFETHMRRFIEVSMQAAWGDQWVDERVPSDVRQNWREKQQKARDNGETGYPLIAYADFTDYVKIITQKHNWDRVFKPIFRRRESVTESFYRLYPIRLCTMHARIITQDDELYLRVEVKRLLQAIGISI